MDKVDRVSLHVQTLTKALEKLLLDLATDPALTEDTQRKANYHRNWRLG